ncbi:Zinc finger protein [Musa troglodytarum]|uniref:Zinc finger protein n=1 Tax=Musa troglodytarum TaxID=320322 RepID=A0A9E7I3V4_9LILI|nr:hypothetical protein MUK42_37618 [Musa troglodytarum]URE40992.1 Zinc finger protein [Musa troglodytarum]
MACRPLRTPGRNPTSSSPHGARAAPPATPTSATTTTTA